MLSGGALTGLWLSASRSIWPCQLGSPHVLAVLRALPYGVARMVSPCQGAVYPVVPYARLLSLIKHPWLERIVESDVAGGRLFHRG